jgi:hypothetical protein
MALFRVAPATETDVRAVPEANTLPGAVRLFFRFPTPRLLLASLAAWVPIRVVLGGWSPADLLIAAAIVLYWPVQEWAAHAFVLHLRPRTVLGLRIDPLFARYHRWHHRYPHVAERIFVAWPIIAALTPVNLGFWLLVTPSPARAFTGIALFTAAALLYEWVHYSAHLSLPPRTAWMRAVRRHHSLHHFRNEHYWHAFTVPWLDRWLGTAPADPSETPRSPTVRTLGVDDPF